MKLKVPKNTLDKAIKAVCRAVPNKGIQPILNNILLTNDNGHLMLNATDLDFFIEASVPSDNIEPGSITLSAKKLEEIVSKLDDDDILIEANGTTCETKLTCNSANFDLIGVSPDDFPKFVKPKAGVFFSVETSKLSRIIDMVGFAASRYDLNSIIGGVYMSIDGTKLEVAATDGNRLACYETEIESLANNTIATNAIIPVKVISEVQKILEGSVDEKVQIAFLDNQVVFKTEDRFVLSRLLDGVYPKYKQLIPEKSDNIAQVDTKEFLHCLERVAVMANERTNLVKLSFGENILSIQSNNLDFGGAEDEISVEYMGEPIDISFNVKYLTEAIRSIDSEKIQIAMTKPVSPTLVKPISDDKYIYLIMPVKTRS